ncbi:MAG TPA: hypothetical protein VFE58_09000 [Tepidisphaeraceae bacterium]|jgi:hypothetical protein|nr:hypothetical protein [Tepidisphaeraceae bacterium]
MAYTLAQLKQMLSDTHDQEHDLRADTTTAATSAGKKQIAALGEKVVVLNDAIAALSAKPNVSVIAITASVSVLALGGAAFMVNRRRRRKR